MPARGSALLDCSDLPIKLTLRSGKDPRPLMLGENLLDGEPWTLLSLSRTRLEKPAQRGEVTAEGHSKPGSVLGGTPCLASRPRALAMTPLWLQEVGMGES